MTSYTFYIYFMYLNFISFIQIFGPTCHSTPHRVHLNILVFLYFQDAEAKLAQSQLELALAAQDGQRQVIQALNDQLARQLDELVSLKCSRMRLDKFL